jgi:hypothetical protein
MFTHPYMRTIVALLGVAGIVALGAYTALALKQAKYMHTGPVTISVVGEGEVFARPDIATFSFSVVAEGDDAATAQDLSAESLNAILAYLEEEEVEERDIRTQYYNLNPRYEYTQSICDTRGFCPPGEQVLRGYEVNQTVEVKVRNTDNAGELISGVGTRGATNVSGLNFTIDDEEALMAEARAAAIENAKEKAEALAEDLGVRIVRIQNFWEEQGYMPYGRGGDMMMESAAVSNDAAVTPGVPMGENLVQSRVNIIYEVK